MHEKWEKYFDPKVGRMRYAIRLYGMVAAIDVHTTHVELRVKIPFNDVQSKAYNGIVREICSGPRMFMDAVDRAEAIMRIQIKTQLEKMQDVR